MGTTQLKIKGLGTASARMKRRGSKIKRGNRGAIMNILTLVDQTTKRNFDTSGGAHDPPQRWKRLKPATLKTKARKRQSSKPLIAEGRLKRMWTLQATSRKGTYTSQAVTKKKSIPYGSFHHTGTSNLPKRRYLPEVKQVSAIGRRVIGRHIKTSIRTGI